MFLFCSALPIDEDQENKRRSHHYGSVSSNDSSHSSSDENSDDEQDEASASYAAQVEHLQEYEEALFDSYQEILTKQLRTIVKQAQDTVDYD